MEIKSNHPPHTPIPIKSPQPSGSDDNLSLDLESIHQDLTIKAFLTQMEIVDPALLEFSRSVAHYTQLMISSLRFSPEHEKRLQHSSLLHDLGRMGIDRRIIEKKNKLTPQEWEIIHGHPLNTAKVLSVFPYFRDIIPIVKHHHEWYDGTGYPDGLMGEEIPFMSRIIMIADAFVAMTSDRPYRAPLTTDAAMGVIEKNKGVQFDPRLVPPFTTVVSEEPKSSSLQMEKRNG